MQDHQANHLNELGHSPDALAQRRAELLALLSQAAPEVLSDHQQINLDKLKELLGQEHIAGGEHYELSWAGKAAARREIQKTSSHTLLPAASNPPNAPHMLIEGENLEVLRVLQKSYYGKVKMIYIDPPYNTGNDSFVYPDDYSETLDEYQKRTGEKNEAGFLNKQNLWKKNSKESGQYHSAWLSMMYPRLYLARNLLRDDGVIFISIDDNEAANLKLLCDEIFGAENFLATYTLKVRYEGKTLVEDMDFQKLTENVYLYAKLKRSVVLKKNEAEYAFDKFEWVINEIRPSKKIHLGGKLVEIFEPEGYEIAKGTPSIEKLKEIWATGTILDGNSSGRFFRDFLASRSDEDGLGALYKVYGIGDDDLPYRYFTGPKRKDATKGKYYQGVPRTVLENIDNAKKTQPIITYKDFSGDFGNCRHEGGVDFRNGKKPLALLEYLTSIVDFQNNDIVLDFFAGSGTTAHAVIELNAEDGGTRQCISVQMPEVLAEDSEAYKAGYRTIADITRARIDKVIAKLKAEKSDLFKDGVQNLACAHFTLAPSNFKVWRSQVSHADALRDQLALFQSAEKNRPAPQATDAQTAMLAELLLKNGLGALGVHAISKPKQIAGVTVHRVLLEDNRTLWLCFEPYTQALKDEIVKARPAQVILLNSCFVGQDGHGADELLANLQLELAGLDIGLTVI